MAARAKDTAAPALGPGEAPGFDAALEDYFLRDEWPREPFSAAKDLLRGLRLAAEKLPLRGYTRGQVAEDVYWLKRREARELAEFKPGSVVNTELRDVLAKSGSYAQRTAGKAALLRAAQRIRGLRGHRVGKCLRYMSREGPRADGQRVVEVVAREERQPELGCDPVLTKPRYRGVVVCGQGWVCPVCASKITERRRKELRRGLQRWRGRGRGCGPGAVVMMTCTYSHGPADELAPQWAALGRAQQIFARSAKLKAWRRATGWAGRVRAREITFGINGWHPHAHTLELVEGDDCTAEAVEAWRPVLAAAWRRALQSVGLDCSDEHGFTMALTSSDDDIAKWGLDAELAKWHVKANRLDPDAPGEAGLHGYSPFDLLRIHAGEAQADPRMKLSRDRAAALFTEYARAVKGTAQLHFTRGLKDLLELDELTEAEAAEADEEGERVVGTLTAGEWFTVVSTNQQLEFLALVQSGGIKYAKLFLAEWRDRLKRWQHAADSRHGALRKLQYLWRGS